MDISLENPTLDNGTDNAHITTVVVFMLRLSLVLILQIAPYPEVTAEVNMAEAITMLYAFIMKLLYLSIISITGNSPINVSVKKVDMARFKTKAVKHNKSPPRMPPAIAVLLVLR